METSTILGYAAMAKGEELKPFYYQPPSLGENDIRVNVTHCGLCHTDIHGISDLYNMINYPFVPGHEVVGYVSQVGSAVTEHQIGDRVGIGWQGRSCMQCEWCKKGQEQLCMDIEDSATWVPYGGFAASVMADHRFAFPLPEAMPSEVAAVLMCAGLSVFNPLQHYANTPKNKLAIVGVGGLGHLAIQYAHAMNYEVTVISSTPEKEDEALRFGADRFILSSDTNTLDEAAFYFDLLLVTGTGNLPWRYLLYIMKKEGKIVVVSFPEIAMNPTNLVAHNISIIGSLLGDRATMREMLAFSQLHHIEPVIELMPMAQVNEAIHRLEENKVRYRIVLMNE